MRYSNILFARSFVSAFCAFVGESSRFFMFLGFSVQATLRRTHPFHPLIKLPTLTKFRLLWGRQHPIMVALVMAAREPSRVRSCQNKLNCYVFPPLPLPHWLERSTRAPQFLHYIAPNLAGTMYQVGRFATAQQFASAAPPSHNKSSVMLG